MRKNLILYSLLIGLFTFPTSLFSQSDSSALSEAEYLKQVVQYHPLARKALNLRDYGEFSVLAAKGGFDPYLSSKNKQKYYDDKNYYLISNSGVNLPTRLGLSLQAGYDWNDGLYINEQNTLPENGLWYAGVSVPLLQGLLIDENRTNLRKAFLDREYYENESQILLNNLLLEATNHYWTWVQIAYKKNTLDEAYDFALTNFNNYKTAYLQGDKPAIDTLEAKIQLQNFEVQRQQAINELRAAELTLMSFLWQDELQPQEDTVMVPETILLGQLPLIDSLQLNRESFIAQHPMIENYEIKRKKQEVENRMKREKLKPKLNAEYNIIQTPSTSFAEIRGLDNYNWGLSFSFPLFLRKERGELKMSNVKLQNADFEFQQKRLSVINKAKQYEFAFQNVSQQLQTYGQVTDQYRTLLEAEVRKFDIGESSIFLINYRQLALVNAELKLIELQTKYQMYYRQWMHSLGVSQEIWLTN